VESDGIEGLSPAWRNRADADRRGPGDDSASARYDASGQSFADPTAEEFSEITRLLRRVAGVHLRPGKEQLVRARLGKRLRLLGLASYAEYVRILDDGRHTAELHFMIDALTTNKTSFFREPQHLEFLRALLRKGWAADRPLRIWSAGCSSGEEPYSIAIVLLEEKRDAGTRILATDISRRILAVARAGLYEAADISDVPRQLVHRHFVRAGEDGSRYEVTGPARSLVRFASLNLMDDWPMRGPFDLIFCRNVMIYFDPATREQLVRRFLKILQPAGYLFVGHSESLFGAIDGLTYVQPAVYQA
jgi:chemotaxis protein methyltransferase CheR